MKITIFSVLLSSRKDYNIIAFLQKKQKTKKKLN